MFLLQYTFSFSFHKLTSVNEYAQAKVNGIWHNLRNFPQVTNVWSSFNILSSSHAYI